MLAGARRTVEVQNEMLTGARRTVEVRYEMLTGRVTRFEFVKKRTLCRRTPPPQWSFWTSFSHAYDPAPSPATKF